MITSAAAVSDAIVFILIEVSKPTQLTPDSNVERVAFNNVSLYTPVK